MKLLNTLKHDLETKKELYSNNQIAYETLSNEHVVKTEKDVNDWLVFCGCTEHTNLAGDLITFVANHRDGCDSDTILLHVKYPSKWNSSYEITIDITSNYALTEFSKSIRMSSATLTSNSPGAEDYTKLIVSSFQLIGCETDSWLCNVIDRKKELIKLANNNYSLRESFEKAEKKVKFVETMLDTFFTLLPKKGQIIASGLENIESLAALVPEFNWKMTRHQKIVSILKYTSELTDTVAINNNSEELSLS